MKKKKKLLPTEYYWNKPTPMVHRSKRLMEWLKEAELKEVYDSFLGRTFKVGSIPLHCEGGVAFNKDLRFLVANGFLEMKRIAYSKGWGGNYDLKRTRLFLTEKGQLAVDKGKLF